MNIALLKQEIIDQSELIETILDKIGFAHIKDYGNEYRCAKEEGANPTGVCVKKDTLSAFVRSSGKDISGDIFTLVQNFKGMNFPEAIDFVCCAIGKTFEHYNKDEEEVILPFGGYYKGLKKNAGDIFKPLTIYSESVLEEFIDISSSRFYKDNISLEAQAYFEVMYDPITDRIILPWRNAIGQIVGIMGRYNASADYCNEHNIPKWFPIIPFSKKQVLFGFFENYRFIQEQKTIFIGESEKFPLQLRSMEIPYICEKGNKRFKGLNLGVAVGTHTISEYQKTLIQSCYPNCVIVCFDEGLEIEEVEKEAKKIKSKSNFTQCKVGYIYDKENKYLPKGSKASPSDYGIEVFNHLVCECVIWV